MVVSAEHLNIPESDGATINATSSCSMQGIPSKPVAFLTLISDNNLTTTETDVAFKENILSVGFR